MKNCLAEFAAENFEIGTYRSLIAAAEDMGEPEIARRCREILPQEEAMAAWLQDQIPVVTRLILHQVATPDIDGNGRTDWRRPRRCSCRP